MTDHELFQMALDALEDACGDRCNREHNPCWQREAAEAIRARLAQGEPEPVAWMHIQGDHEDPCFRELTEDEISRGWTQKPLYYTAPPQREWVGLTDEEIDEAHETTMSFYGFARAIEAKLKEKNA